MINICDYFNPCSTKFHAIQQFKTLSCEQKICLGAITTLFLCTIFLIPVVTPVFRLLVGRCIPKVTEIPQTSSAIMENISPETLDSIRRWQLKVKKLILNAGHNSTKQQEKQCRDLLEEHPEYLNKFLLIGELTDLKDTLLHLLAKVGPPQFVAIFAEFNADFSLQDDTPFKNTPLHWAIANANNGTALAIIEHAPHTVLNMQCIGGNTPLHLAIAKGYTDCSSQGDRLECSNFELTRALIEKGARLDIANFAKKNLSSSGGNTPLHLACARRDLPTMRLLIQNHVKLKIRNNSGKTALDLIDLTYEEASNLIRDTVSPFLLPKELFDKSLQEAREILAATP